LERIGLGFRKAVTDFAAEHDIPMVRFAKGQRKVEVMRPYLERLERQGRTGVAAIGVAQEFQRVFTGTTHRAEGGGAPHFSYTKADRRVTAYYFYLVDEIFGPAFVKICAYFPYPVKIWLNGHEYAKRAATKAGIGFTELANGFAATDDPAGLRQVCDTLGPGAVRVFAERWWARLPLPFTPADRPPATGGTSRCGRWRSPAPSCSTSRATPGRSSRHCWWTTSTSAAPNTCRSSSGGGSGPTRPAATAPGWYAMATTSPSTPTSGIPG
jgi:hypothetical protein